MLSRVLVCIFLNEQRHVSKNFDDYVLIRNANEEKKFEANTSESFYEYACVCLAVSIMDVSSFQERVLLNKNEQICSLYSLLIK